MALGITRRGDFTTVPTMLDKQRYNDSLRDQNWRYNISPPVGHLREHQRNCYFQSTSGEINPLPPRPVKLSELII